MCREVDLNIMGTRPILTNQNPVKMTTFKKWDKFYKMYDLSAAVRGAESHTDIGSMLKCLGVLGLEYTRITKL